MHLSGERVHKSILCIISLSLSILLLLFSKPSSDCLSSFSVGLFTQLMLFGARGKKEKVAESWWFPRGMTEEERTEEGNASDLSSGPIEWNSALSHARCWRGEENELLTRTIALHLSFVISSNKEEKRVDRWLICLSWLSKGGERKRGVRADHLFCPFGRRLLHLSSRHRHASSTEENLLVLFSRQIYIYIYSFASPSSILISLFLRLLRACSLLDYSITESPFSGSYCAVSEAKEKKKTTTRSMCPGKQK